MGVYLNMIKTLGLSLEELNIMEYGMIMDMVIEKGNDEIKYRELATQADFDRF